MGEDETDVASFSVYPSAADAIAIANTTLCVHFSRWNCKLVRVLLAWNIV